MMIRNDRRGYKNMATENGVYNTTCNMHKTVLYQTIEIQSHLISTLFYTV